MQLIFENWRKYTQSLLTEVSYKEIVADKQGLDKKIKKIIKSYNYERGEDPGYEMEELHRNFEKWMLEDTIPGDLTDNQRGLSVLWLIKMAREDPAATAEWTYSLSGRGNVGASLETFFHHPQFMPQKDLMQVKSLSDLEKMTEEAKPDIEAHRQKQIKKPELIKEGTTFLRGDWAPGEDLQTVPENGWVIMEIHNKAAACFHGTADWCTAAPGLQYFEEYYRPDNPLFIFENKKNLNKFQFHYKTKQFMDKKDKPVSDKDFDTLHGLLTQTDAYQKYEAIRRFDLHKMAVHPDSPIDEIRKLVNTFDDPEKELTGLMRIRRPHIISKKAMLWLGGKEFYDNPKVAWRLMRLHRNIQSLPSALLEDIAENHPDEYAQARAKEQLYYRAYDFNEDFDPPELPASSYL